MWTLKWRRIRKVNLIRAADYRYRSWNCKMAFTGSTKGNFTWQYSFRYIQNHPSFYFYGKDGLSGSTKVWLEMTEFANLVSCQSRHKWSTYSSGGGWELLWKTDGGNPGSFMSGCDHDISWYGDQILSLFAMEMNQGRESYLIKAVLRSPASQSIIPSFLPTYPPHYLKKQTKSNKTKTKKSQMKRNKTHKAPNYLLCISHCSWTTVDKLHLMKLIFESGQKLHLKIDKIHTYVS